MTRIPDHRDIHTAARRLAPVVRRTPVISLAPGDLGIPVGVTLKLEFLQHTGSFKVRGAVNAIAAAIARSAAGVCAASGGNHGAAVAWAAQAAGVPATVFVPSFAPTAKTDLIRHYGADMRTVDGYYSDALACSLAHAKETGAHHIDAYDDPATVAGQATLGLELADQIPPDTPVLVSCGGGGLFAGIALALAGRNRVTAVEPVSAPSLTEALAAGKPVDIDVGGVAVDSLGARRAGEIAYAVAHVQKLSTLTVRDEAIARARHRLWRSMRIVAEPGGVTALAGLLENPGMFGSEVTVVLSGANAGQ